MLPPCADTEGCAQQWGSRVIPICVRMQPGTRSANCIHQTTIRLQCRRRSLIEPMRGHGIPNGSVWTTLSPSRHSRPSRRGRWPSNGNSRRYPRASPTSWLPLPTTSGDHQPLLRISRRPVSRQAGGSADPGVPVQAGLHEGDDQGTPPDRLLDGHLFVASAILPAIARLPVAVRRQGAICGPR